jgi:hypothetical protein
MPDVPRWEDTLTRRVRSLVRTGPLHRLEAGKAGRTRDLSRHDLRVLALRAIDATIERMGLGHGARRSDLVEALAPLIRASEPDVSMSDIEQIVGVVIAHLLNDQDRRIQFEEPYVAFDGIAATTRTVRFHLLKEEEADDNTIVLKATTEAINLYAGMLEVDAEDAQTAAEAVLKAQIERGAIGAAVATARDARLRSIGYAEALRSTLRQVRRDVSQVDARAMLKTVATARKHLEERLGVERSLIEAVGERLSTPDAPDAPKLVELHDALGDCRQRHLTLHAELQGVNEEWLGEQERQRFRRSRASALPDLERDVLQAMVALSLGQVEPLVDAFILPMHGPSSPSLFNLGALVDGLLAARKREREIDLDAPAADLELLVAREELFGAEVVARVEEWLLRGGTLGELLPASRDAGDAASVRRLLVLRVLWAWDDNPGERRPSSRVGTLNDPEFEGDDLMIGGIDGHE